MTVQLNRTQKTGVVLSILAIVFSVTGLVGHVVIKGSLEIVSLVLSGSTVILAAMMLTHLVRQGWRAAQGHEPGQDGRS
ncbi:hypothetical protein ACH9EU_05675 [Kocuria sp. M1R5S2]|uniref:hypothetical protein n=1 Tax=Kocuria rhizosphaerae TaxID=3376285 RepID=UPI003799F1E6